MLMRVSDLRFSKPPRFPLTGRTNKLLAVATLEIKDEKTGATFGINEWRVLDDGQRLHVAVPTRPKRVECPACGRMTTSGFQYCARCGKQLPLRLYNPDDISKHHHETAFSPRCSNSYHAISRMILEKYLEAVERRNRKKNSGIDHDDTDVNMVEMEEEAMV